MAAPLFNNLKIATINLRSINSSEQTGRTAINKFEFLVQKGYDLLLLTEVKGYSNARKNQIKSFLNMHSKHQYVIEFNSSRTSRGTAIAYRKVISPKILDIKKFECENIMSMDMEINLTKIRVICVYAPNDAGQKS